MCRKQHLHGWCMICFGVGLMTGYCLESWLVCSLGGFALAMAGFSCLRKR